MTIGSECVQKMGRKEISFFGLKVSESGIAIGDPKADALLNAARPGSSSGLRSFLGLAVYCMIQNLATIADPFKELYKDGVRFEWYRKIDSI